MCHQQKLIHAVSCLVWGFALLCFYILGGGTAVDAASDTDAMSAGINLSLPVADNQELSASRLEAFKKEAERQQQVFASEKRQNSSSFQWYNSSLTQSDTTLVAVREQPSMVAKVAQSAAVTSSVSRKSTRAKTMDEKERHRLLAEKKRQLEKLLGVASEEVADTLPSAPVSANVAPCEEVPDGFYGLPTNKMATTAIRAVVHGEHVGLQRGAIVKLRLLDDIVVQSTHIPANTFLYGQLSFTSCRAMIRIENIPYKNAIYPFKATIYDKDGFEGLYVPDNRVEEAARKAGSQAIGSMNLRLPASSLVSNAANAAIGAVQSVAQSSVNEPKISISSNYSVTIKLQLQ